MALRLRIVRGRDVLASSRTLLRGTRASAVLRTLRPLHRGRYTLRVALDGAGGGVTGVQQAVSLG